jgi:hypothetical protein
MSTYDPALGDPGDFFFHYTTRAAAFEHIIPDRQLRLSPAVHVNDPLESNPALLPVAYSSSGDDPEQEYELQVAGMEAMSRLHQLRLYSKVLSLTIDAHGYNGNAEIFGRGYARARMWAQYAEGHRGVCLMFRREPFTASALGQLRERTPSAWADEVRYTQRGILEDQAATLLPAPGTTGADVSEVHLKKHLKSIFFTKLKDWESEHEYRFVEASMERAYSHVDIRDTLVGVIVGWKFPDWQMPGVFEACERTGAQPWRMSWDRSRPSPHPVGRTVDNARPPAPRP